MNEKLTPESEATRLYRHCKRAIGSNDPASYDCPHPDVNDVEDAIAAAEERGRRRGDAERDELRAALRSAAVALNVAEGWLTGLGRHEEAQQMRGWHQKALAALAPRDSGKEGQR